MLTATLIWVTRQYARDTNRMVDEMRRQHRPYIFVAHERDRNSEESFRYRLVLRNTGDRVGTDVRIEVTHNAHVTVWEVTDRAPDGEPIWDENTVEISSLTPCTDGVQSLAPGEEVELGFIDRGWKRKYEKQVLAYTIAYRDGSGVPYQESLSLTYWA